MWHFLALFLCQTSQAGLQFLFLYRVFTQRKVDGLNVKRGRLSIKCRENSFEDLDLSFPLWLCLQPLLNLSEQYGKKTNKRSKNNKKSKKQAGHEESCPLRSSLGLGCGGSFHSSWLAAWTSGGPWFPGLLGEGLDFLPCRRTWLKQMILKILLLFEISKRHIGSEQISLLFKH